MPISVPLHDGPARAWTDRAFALATLAACVALVVMLARVAPDARGFGTHEALGLAPCGWPRLYGKPCPTCGVTTAACLLVHGRPIQALATQPFGATLAAGGIALGLLALFCLARGRSFLAPLVHARYARIVLGLLALLVGSWAYTWLTFAP